MTTDNPGYQEVPAPIVQVQSQAPGLGLRVIWFILVGWWLGQIALLLGWFLNVLVITMPLGLYILNRLPFITTLRSPTAKWTTEQTADGTTVLRAVELPQRNLLLRSVYFVVIGWWFSFIWLEVAWLCGISLVLLPVSFWMFAKSAAVTTLRRT